MDYLKIFYDNLDSVNERLSRIIDNVSINDRTIPVIVKINIFAVYDLDKNRYVKIIDKFYNRIYRIPPLGYQSPVICQGIKTQIISNPDDKGMVNVAYFLYPQEIRTLKPIKF